MKSFSAVLKNFLLLVAICVTTGALAISTSSVESSSTTQLHAPFDEFISVHVETILSQQNDKSIFLEEISISETIHFFSELDLKIPNSASFTFSEAQLFSKLSVEKLDEQFILNKRKLLAAQLFPFHFFW